MSAFSKVVFCVMFCLVALNIGFSQQQSALTTEKIAENIYIVKGGVAKDRKSVV